MPPVAIVTDTTHYLPRALVGSEGIHQVSLYVGWGEERQREIELESFDAFYERLRSDPDLPTTSQPSIGDFLAVWEPLLEAGQDIVSVHLSGGSPAPARPPARPAACSPSAAWASALR